MKISIKDVAFFVMLIVIFGLAVDKCSHTHVIPPDNTRLTTERKEHLAKAVEGKVIHDTLWMERENEKKAGKAKTDTIWMMDSTEVNRIHDSLELTKRKSVVLFYENGSLKKQLSISDSIILTDSARIFHLTTAVLISDTIHANDSLEAVQLRKQVQKERNGKRLWQTTSLILGTLLIIK